MYTTPLPTMGVAIAVAQDMDLRHLDAEQALVQLDIQ